MNTLFASLMTPDVVKSIIRHGLMALGTVAGYSAVMNGGDVDAVVSAVFTIGSTAWGWYDAHQHATLKTQTGVTK